MLDRKRLRVSLLHARRLIDITSQVNADLGCVNQEQIWDEERQSQDGLIRDVMGFTSIYDSPYIRLVQ